MQLAALPVTPEEVDVLLKKYGQFLSLHESFDFFAPFFNSFTFSLSDGNE
jgi:hypothetical protein